MSDRVFSQNVNLYFFVQNVCTQPCVVSPVFNFSADYANALLHYEKGITKLPGVRLV